MPFSQDQPANRLYKRELADLRVPLPRWWPGRLNAEVVGGDLESGAVIMHLPVGGDPYLARVRADGAPGGNTGTTLAELDRTMTRYEWIEGEWKYIVFCRGQLSYEDLGHIKVSMRATPLETSSRSVVFDPTDDELFNLQRQGFDWRLLQNGFVHTCRDRFTLDTAAGHLVDLHYLTHSFDASVWHDIVDMHTAFAETMSFPAYYGRNLDALNDVLSDVGRYSYGSDPHSAGTVVTIAGFDSLLELDRRTALLVLDIFARQARLAALYGHAMLCLIETTNHEFDRVGGMGVSGVSVSESPPDPPRPFDESVVVVFSFDIYATPAEAEQYAVDLQTATAQVLDEIGRYQIRSEIASSDHATKFEEFHSRSGPQCMPGQNLVDVSIGVRGRGDQNVLGEDIYHAVTAARLRFVQMTDRIAAGPDLERVLALYPDLV
ncbi:Barstar (barnase inhibitor) [Rhodococcoides kyotonense]|uniref:Barstar (Barnase inhibitor) n=2 Tax=Rhodococcoides kyotonense TaxID=398843 RepID=A0A239MB39_9NOCA|nr:Barstar (barnase inhibitor) [Rhodococcus kyotonensis]